MRANRSDRKCNHSFCLHLKTHPFLLCHQSSRSPSFFCSWHFSSLVLWVNFLPLTKKRGHTGKQQEGQRSHEYRKEVHRGHLHTDRHFYGGKHHWLPLITNIKGFTYHWPPMLKGALTTNPHHKEGLTSDHWNLQAILIIAYSWPLHSAMLYTI